MGQFLSLPLKTKMLTSSGEHPRCDIKESIVNHIHLITTSYFGECSFDETFGCSIWDVDFDNLESASKLKQIIVESLHESLRIHEKRLTNINVSLRIKQEEVLDNKSSNVIKKKVDIKINGKVKKTNEDFSYVEYFYIGPLSY